MSPRPMVKGVLISLLSLSAFGEDNVEFVQTSPQRGKTPDDSASQTPDESAAPLPQAAPASEPPKALTKGRVWFACTGLPLGSQTPDEKEVGLIPMQTQTCTPALIANDLCCADWAQLPWVETRKFAPTSIEAGNVETNQDQEVVQICTMAASSAGLLEEAGSRGGGLMPAECVEMAIGKQDVVGGEKPGMAVLEARILWFAKQGLAPEDLPTCKKLVDKCPAGHMPNSVSDEFLLDLEEQHTKELSGRGKLITFHSGYIVAEGGSGVFGPGAKPGPKPQPAAGEDAPAAGEEASELYKHGDSSQRSNSTTGTGCGLPADASAEACFGLQGAKCDKAPGDGCSGNNQAVSVGSLAHDECCLGCTIGVGCSLASIAFDIAFSFPDSMPCAYEWRKAWWNSIDNRDWCSSRLSSSTSNYLGLTGGSRTWTKTNYWGSSVGTGSVPWRTATLSLCAPGGTSLDCVGCSSYSGRRRNGQDGDHDFCCSGNFQRVDYHWWSGKRWGTCS